MIRPVGQLPAQIYWRRRMLLAGIVLAVAVAAGWFFTRGASGDPGAANTAAATPTSTAGPADGQALTGLEQVAVNLVPLDAAGAGDPAASGAPAEGAAATTAAPAQAEPGPCPDEAIALSVYPEAPQYASGSKPRFDLTVTNISAVACFRDLDPGLQTWGLFAADGTRLWGSNDCYPDPTVPTPQLLQPGQVTAFVVTWSGKTSEETCTVARQILGPGSYVLRGYLGNLVSPDTLLVLT